jgi:hypothetical protein
MFMNQTDTIGTFVFVVALPLAVAYMFWRAYCDFDKGNGRQALLLLMSTAVLGSGQWISQNGPSKTVLFLVESGPYLWIACGLVAICSFAAMLLWRLRRR